MGFYLSSLSFSLFDSFKFSAHFGRFRPPESLWFSHTHLMIYIHSHISHVISYTYAPHHVPGLLESDMLAFHIYLSSLNIPDMPAFHIFSSSHILALWNKRRPRPEVESPCLRARMGDIWNLRWWSIVTHWTVLGDTKRVRLLWFTVTYVHVKTNQLIHQRDRWMKRYIVEWSGLNTKKWEPL